MYKIKKNVCRILARILRPTSFDMLYLKVVYYYNMGKYLNLKNPKAFSEKLQWLKLYNRKPEYTKMVDKYAVKKYVADVIGEEYVIPTLGVWDRPEDIEWDKLPNQFVLKTTHGGGNTGVVICKDKTCLNKQHVIDKLNASLKIDLYKIWREWPYKNVTRRIIAEQYLTDESGKELKDYKFFCFSGNPMMIQLDFDRFSEHKKNLYSPEWKLLPFSFNYPSHPEINFPKPQKLEEMLGLARKLSNGCPFLRVDLYWTGNRVYFGELTFFPASGVGHFKPIEYDLKLGELIQLPCKITYQ